MGSEVIVTPYDSFGFVPTPECHYGQPSVPVTPAPAGSSCRRPGVASYTIYCVYPETLHVAWRRTAWGEPAIRSYQTVTSEPSSNSTVEG